MFGDYRYMQAIYQIGEAGDEKGGNQLFNVGLFRRVRSKH